MFGAIDGFKQFGLTLATITHSLTSQVSRMNGIAAEINRYVKDRDQRIITEPPPTLRPSIFANYDYISYRYTELKTDRHIRLLKLQPGLDEEEFIRCKLEAVALEDHPEYEALSYTWGILPLDFPILVIKDEAPDQIPTTLFITPTLYAALKRLNILMKKESSGLTRSA
jgi:hypothetical protein